MQEDHSSAVGNLLVLSNTACQSILAQGKLLCAETWELIYLHLVHQTILFLYHHLEIRHDRANHLETPLLLWVGVCGLSSLNLGKIYF